MRKFLKFFDVSGLIEHDWIKALSAESLQSCPTLCDSIDGSPPGSPVPGILQAKTLEWVVISFSNAWKWKVKVESLSLAQLLVTPWTAAYQAPSSMGFSRQEYWSGVPLPSPIKALGFKNQMMLPDMIASLDNYWSVRKQQNINAQELEKL